MHKFIKLLLVSILALHSALFSQEPYVLSMQGHLSSEMLQDAGDQLDALSTDAALLLHINSSSGELSDGLKLAQKIYNLKQSANLTVSVYIDQKALGTAALFPLLADQWMTTPVMVWGDIVKDAHGKIPLNQLQATVLNLIPQEAPNSDTLNLLAQAMINPSVQLVQRGQWELIPQNPPGSPLVVNEHQLDAYSISHKTLTPAQFSKEVKIEPMPVAVAITTATTPLDERLKAAIAIDPKGENLVGYLSIEKDRAIDESTYLYVKFAIEQYKKRRVSFILLNLNTPGGEVFASMKIANLLHKIDVEDHIPVVAFIDNWAISAGAMLAYSSRFIGIVKSASMGAAEPVTVGAEGKMESASEKVNSALRAEFANLAHFYGRNPLIAEAMVDKDMILVRRHGKVVRLEKEDEIRSQGEDPDEVITRKRKLLTLNAEELIEYGIADFMVQPHALTPITEQELSAGQWSADKNLLFQQPFFAAIPNAQIISYHDWKIDFFALLSNPLISSLLFMGLIIGVYMEMSHPGLSLPGILALVCLSLILLSSFAAEAASWLEIIILLVGLCLILVEVFIIPGFGFTGILGILLTLFALFTLMVPTAGPLEFNWDCDQLNFATLAFIERLGYFIGTLILSLIVIAVLARYLSPTFLRKSRIILEGDQEGTVAGIEVKAMPAVGTEGTSHSDLRPGGKILINNQVLDAVTDGTVIDKDEKIIVQKIDGLRIVVGRKPKA